MTRFEFKPINLVLMQIVGPALIILMISSLVFFFIEVLYRGPHVARLYWVMGLFTFAAVLVSRISIEEGRERAQLFGWALAAATLVSAMQLVQFSYSGLAFMGPIVVTALIAVVMWSSSKLTWDCTVVDRSRDSSATGLVDIFRKRFNLDAEDKTAQLIEQEEEPTGVEKFIRWFSGANQKNTPGIWVFYFAIFAFPVFGLLQWFVRSEAKTWVFVLFAVYLGSTLCLLMTTSLLGLERYLAKRKLHVPASVARNWMMVGGTFALMMVLLVMLIPKPASSGSAQDWLSFLTSPLRASSKIAPGKDGQEHQDDARKKQHRDDAQQTEEGEKGSGGNNENEDGEGGNSKSKSEGKNGNNKNDNSDSSDNKKKSDSQKNDSKTDKDQSQKAEQNKKSNRDSNESEGNPNRQQVKKQRQQNNANQNKDRNQRQQAQRQDQSKNNQSSAIKKFLESTGQILNWLVYIVGFFAACFLLCMFRNDIAKFLAAIFGKKKVEAKNNEATPVVEHKDPPPSYRSFSDPFRSGKANSMRANQVLEYTLEALEAWSREFGFDRDPNVTLDEFSRQISEIDPKVSKYASQFADVYGRIAFGNERVAREELNPLIKLWRSMDQALAQSRRKTPVES